MPNRVRIAIGLTIATAVIALASMVYDLTTARSVSPLSVLLLVGSIVSLVWLFTGRDYWPRTRRAQIVILILAFLLGLAGSLWYNAR